MVIRPSNYRPPSKSSSSSSSSSSMTSTHAVLDHVVWLMSYEELQNAPHSLGLLFNVIPGGTHSDGRTENKLIVFRDGTYIELIAFVNDDPEKRRGHPWDLPDGVIDFAFSVIKPRELDEGALAARMERSGTGVRYSPLRDGGRRTPKGVELKWQTSVPDGIDRGDVPFWCIDVTPRERRVPWKGEEGEKATTHPCSVTGMRGVKLRLDDAETADRAAKALRALLDLEDGREIELGSPLERTRFHELKTVVDVGVRGELDDKLLVLGRGGEEYEPPKKDPVVLNLGGSRLQMLFE